MPEVLTQLFITSVIIFIQKCVVIESWHPSHLTLHLNSVIRTKLVPKPLSPVNG